MLKRVFGIGFVIVVILAVVAYYLSTIVKPQPSQNISPQDRQAALDRLNDAVKNPQPVSGANEPSSQPSAPQADSTTSRSSTQSSAPIASVAPKGDIQVKFAESDVNTMIQTNKDVQQNMARVGATAAQLHFFSPNIVDVTAWVTINGMQRQITVSGALQPDPDGGMSFHTDASQIGELPLPKGITADRLDHEADKILAMVMPVLPLSVKTVGVEGNQLVLTGPSKPAQVGH